MEHAQWTVGPFEGEERSEEEIMARWRIARINRLAEDGAPSMARPDVAERAGVSLGDTIVGGFTVVAAVTVLMGPEGHRMPDGAICLAVRNVQGYPSEYKVGWFGRADYVNNENPGSIQNGARAVLKFYARAGMHLDIITGDL